MKKRLKNYTVPYGDVQEEYTDYEEYDDVQTIIKLKPSIMVTYWWWVLSVFGTMTFPLIGLVFIPLTLWKIIQVLCITYTITETNIIIQKGVFLTTRTVIPLFRIRSIQKEQPLHYWIWAMVNVRILTSDRIAPEVLIWAVGLGGKGDEFVDGLSEAATGIRKAN